MEENKQKNEPICTLFSGTALQIYIYLLQLLYLQLPKFPVNIATGEPKQLDDITLGKLSNSGHSEFYSSPALGQLGHF